MCKPTLPLGMLARCFKVEKLLLIYLDAGGVERSEGRLFPCVGRTDGRAAN